MGSETTKELSAFQGRLRGGMLCALLAVAAVVFCAGAYSVDKAYAAEATYVGDVRYEVSYDEDGCPLYNEDGTLKKDAAYVYMSDIENVSGAITIPATFDVVTRASDGTETVTKNVTPAYLALGVNGVDFNNTAITSIDVTNCTSAKWFSFSHLNSVEAINMQGLSQFNVVFNLCDNLSSVNMDGCTLGDRYALKGCPQLALPDFTQPQWSTLSDLDIEERTDFTAFDASLFPNLTSLSLINTGIETLNPSACQQLAGLYVKNNRNLTVLDSNTIPQSVSWFSCTNNEIADTDALVERFGASHVLPQGSSQTQGGLNAIESYMLARHMLPGSNKTVWLNGRFVPSSSEASNFDSESTESKYAVENFTVSSSDPSVLTAEIGGDNYYGASLVMSALKAGTTTVTVTYSFTGQYGTYEGTQVVDLAVAGKANPITSLSCDAQATASVVTACALCGETHAVGKTIPLQLTLEDSSRPLTDVDYVVATSSDASIVEASFDIDPGEVDSAYGIYLIPRGVGTATITLNGTTQGDSDTETTASTTMEVTVTEADVPTLHVEKTYKTLLPSNVGDTMILIAPGNSQMGSALATYVENDALKEMVVAHGNAFTYGHPVNIQGQAVPVLSVTSSNESVAAPTTQRESIRLAVNKEGETEVNITDVWGNEGTCNVEVVDPASEAKKLSLSKDEVTIKVGETLDLAALVQGRENLDVMATELPLVFKSSNGYIAPTTFSGSNSLEVAKLVGRNVGDVTVSAGVLTGRFYDSNIEYLDKWQTADFGTLTVHVVADDPVPDSDIVTSLTFDEASTNLEFVSKCPVDDCGAAHGAEKYLTLSYDTKDSSVNPSETPRIAFEGYDESIVDVQQSDGTTLDQRTLKVWVKSVGVGSTPVKATITNADGSKVEATLQVQVTEAGMPKFAMPEERAYRIDELAPVVKHYGAGNPDPALQQGMLADIAYYPGMVTGPMQSGRNHLITLYVASVVSDNEDVVSCEHSGTYMLLNLKKPGTANVTVTDIWGRTKTTKVTVRDIDVVISSQATVAKGQTLDLVDLVTGTDYDERYLEFVVSDGDAVSIKKHWNEATKKYEFLMTGNKAGTATVTARYRVRADSWGDSEYRDLSTIAVTVTDPDAQPNPATGIEVTGASNSLTMGSTLQLSAAITPVDADNAQDLTWSSADESVATVSATGLVTPMAPGKTTITAAIGSVQGTYELTVATKVIPATSVTLSAATTAMTVGASQQLTATVAPSDATDDVVWTTSNANVLTVDQSGKVTAVGNGSATVTATAGSASASTPAIVVSTPVSGVSLDSSTLALYAGADASQLTANIQPATASNTSVSWSSSNPSVATVDKQGAVTPLSAGVATITVRTEDGGFEASCAVTVSQHATGVVLDKHELAIVGAGTASLQATVGPDDATNKDVIWSTSNEAVANVDEHGLVTSAGKGQATVTVATVDGAYSDTCAVTVTNPATSLTVAPATLDLIKGNTAQATFTLSGALAGQVDDVALTWTSSDEAVASVAEDGTITALKTGSATVEAHVGSLVATCSVRVTNPVQSVAIPSALTVELDGEAPTLSLTVAPSDADAYQAVWTSSNPAVATVDKKGSVSIHAAGVANIVASVQDKSATCVLTVKEKEVAVSSPADANFGASITVKDTAALDAYKKLADDGLNLVVKEINNLTTPAKQALEALEAAGLTAGEPFDVSLQDNKGKTITFNKDAVGNMTITVKTKLTDTLREMLGRGMELKVCYLGDNGAVEYKRTWIEGDFLYFETDHLSTYVVMSAPPQGAGSEVADEQPSQQDKPLPLASDCNKLAATGDSSAGMLTLAITGLALVLATGARLASKRRMR